MPATCSASSTDQARTLLNQHALPLNARERSTFGRILGLRVLDRVVQNALGIAQPPRLEQSPAKVGQQRRTPRVVMREQRGCSFQQTGGAAGIPAEKCGPRRRVEPFGRLGRQRPFRVADGRQLRGEAVGPFQVIADHLGLRARRRLQLVRHLLVQFGSKLFGHGVIRGFSDKGMCEPEAVPAIDFWTARADELLVHERWRDAYRCLADRPRP